MAGFKDAIEGAATQIEQLRQNGYLTIKTVDGEVSILHPPYTVESDYISGGLVRAQKEPRRIIRFGAIAWYERR